MKRLALLFMLFSVPALAQQQPPPAKPPAAGAPKQVPAPAAPKPPAAPMAPSPPPAPPVAIDPSAGGQPVNIRLDVSLIDQQENSAGQPKTLMVILADKAFGQARAAYEDRSVSVDARPTIADSLIRVMVTVKSEEPHRIMVPDGPMKSPDPLLNWSNSFTLLLPSGKPVVALETSDAVTKRKMSIEVKATILK